MPNSTEKITTAPSNHPFKGRKFATMTGLIVASTGLLWFKRLPSAEWVNFNKWVFGIYAGGNVGSKTVSIIKDSGLKVSAEK